MKIFINKDLEGAHIEKIKAVSPDIEIVDKIEDAEVIASSSSGMPVLAKISVTNRLSSSYLTSWLMGAP